MLKKFSKFFTENTHSPSHLENENNELSNKDIALMEKVSRLKRNKLKNDAAILSALSAGVAGIGYLGHRLEKSDPLYRGSRMIRTTKTAGKIGAGVSLATAGLAGYLHYKDKKDKQNSKIREYDNIKNKSFSEEEDKDYIDKLEKKKARSKITGAVTGTATTLGGGLLGYHSGSKIGAAVGKKISADTLAKAADKLANLEDFMHTLVKADKQVKLSTRTGRIVGTGLGLATGAYLGKKHYDKKEREIEEKIRRYKKADEDNKELMREGFDTIKKSKQYSEKEDKEYLNNSNKKAADKSKNVQELAGAAIGGSTSLIGGSYIGSKLEKKILEKYNKVYDEAGRENLKKDLIDLVGEKGYEDIKNHHAKYNRDFLNSREDREILEELLDAKKYKKGMELDLNKVGINKSPTVPQSEFIGPSNVPRNGQRVYKFNKNQMSRLPSDTPPLDMEQVYRARHKGKLNIKALDKSYDHLVELNNLGKEIGEIQAKNSLDSSAKKDALRNILVRGNKIAVTGLTAAGLATGAYIGKKHYDKKKKEIEEKLKNKRA